MPKNINIFLSVIDNLGDIGFACELIRSFQKVYPGRYFFDIWTDSKEQVEGFFSRNSELSGVYSIRKIKKLHEKTGNLSFLLLHHSIPEDYSKEENELFLRIDYLSFDTEWVKLHGTEHISSTEKQKIIEIIPSPLTESGGLITPIGEFHNRKYLADFLGLDEEKKWVSIFAYGESLEKKIRFDEIDTNTEVILLGTPDRAKIQSSLTLKTAPFLSLKEFSSLIKESHWAIVRGEVSLISTLQIGTPFMWDMYKQIGGLNREQGKQYLDWIDAHENYRDIFHRMNGQKRGNVHFSELESFFSKNMWKYNASVKNLVKEMQKYIDKLGFSL